MFNNKKKIQNVFHKRYQGDISRYVYEYIRIYIYVYVLCLQLYNILYQYKHKNTTFIFSLFMNPLYINTNYPLSFRSSIIHHSFINPRWLNHLNIISFSFRKRFIYINFFQRSTAFEINRCIEEVLRLLSGYISIDFE